MVIGNLEMAILLMRAEFLAKSVQAGTLNKFSKAGLESQEPSVLSDHCNAEITQCTVGSLVMYCHISDSAEEWVLAFSEALTVIFAGTLLGV